MPSPPQATVLKIERMLSIAPAIGVDLDDLDTARRHLTAHEREHDKSWSLDRRIELARAMNAEIEVLVSVYRKLEAPVDRMPAA